jgi:hypothetical protein
LPTTHADDTAAGAVGHPHHTDAMRSVAWRLAHDIIGLPAAGEKHLAKPGPLIRNLGVFHSLGAPGHPHVMAQPAPAAPATTAPQTSASPPPGKSLAGTISSVGARIGVDVINGTNIAAGGLLVGRMMFARKKAFQEGHWKKWTLELIGQSPTNDIVPYETGHWRTAYVWQNALVTGLGAISLIAGGLNLWDGIHRRGFRHGVFGTRSGRTGLAQSLAGAVSLGISAIAAWKGRKAGFMGMLHAMNEAPWRGAMIPQMVAMGTAQLYNVNQLGAFDIADYGNTKSDAAVEWNALKGVPRNALMLIF